MPQALIVGASRGIGLGLVREYAERGWTVTATVRDEAAAAAVQDAGAAVEVVDVTDETSRATLAQRLEGRSFDAVILNAGVSGPRRMGGPDADLLQTLHANAVGPTQLAWALKNTLKPGGVLAFTTSQMGSIADSSGGADTYRASKAALNAYARAFFKAGAEPKGVAVLSLHPGWVKTDMGGENAPVSVEDSARGLVDVIAAHAGRVEHRFLDYTGKELPW
jgi:NAD(P)-dependent dehydrogenase (short-subunit alcohol dehydrogenase family)